MLLKAPESWPYLLVAIVAMVLLAVLDLVGAFAAKEAVLRQSPMLGAAGAACFLLLFYVYACSLQYADLAPVTFGWVVILQVGVVLLDRFRYGVDLSIGAWIAITVIIAGQAYLLLATNPAAPQEVS
jgi:multidrug transporter EmrE-like cation transporter